MVFKKLTRRVTSLVTTPFKKPRRPPHRPPSPPPLPLSPPPEEPPPMEPPQKRKAFPFLFPESESHVLPEPSVFFAPELLYSPLPTNSFFQNFVLKNGDQPEYIHPYLIRLSSSSLSLSYPMRFANSSFIYQVFNPDFTISATQNDDPSSRKTHIISSFSDLSVTVDFPSSNLQFFLVRGSPFLTCSVLKSTCLTISTIHAILSFSSNATNTKYVIKLNNNQTWVLYASSPIKLMHDLSIITSDSFVGIIRLAVLPDSDPKYEFMLDRFSSCYPVSGGAVFSKPYCVDYRWESRGWGDLLMLAHPLHLKLLSGDDGDCSVTILDDFKYKSIDGDLVGVVGNTWSLNAHPVSITWHSIGGISHENCGEIISALCKDVEGLDSSWISTNSSYFYGKLIARAARMALIAEEVGYPDAIPVVRKFLKEAIEPWLDGSFDGNGFLYDRKWGGIVTKQGSADSGADFGFGIYNDHHYHLGYFLYGIAVLAKIDPSWGRKYKPQAYSLMADFMNLGKRANSNYTRLRCFDLYKLHSWAGGLTEFADGRNQESTSEAVNAYYSAALMGLAYGDTHLVSTGSTLAAMEMLAAQTFWHVREGEEAIYEEEFSKANKVVGVLWANKRDSGLWFAPPDWRECRLGIQVLPLSPITEVLFPDLGFVRDLVNWTMPALGRVGVGEGWKGFVYALEGMYDKESALEKIRNLKGFDDGNSLSNLLWWIHSRGDDEECIGPRSHCWYPHYCH